MTVEDRFWAKVDQDGECWLWTGSNYRGYGRLRVGSRRDGTRRLELATHLAWTIANGPVPDGMWVLHRCDNPPCVRPDHLFVGTCADNVHDMIAKGRACHPRMPGELSRRNKLSNAAVAAIRARSSGGEPQSSLAAEYGVSRSLVCMVVRGKRWAS